MTTELQERLGAAERELEDAQQAVGAAVLDGTDTKQAAQRETRAQSELRAAHAAIVEADRRAQQAVEQEQARLEAVSRWRYIAWHFEYAKLIRPVIELRAQLEAAEQRAKGFGSPDPLLRLPDEVVGGNAFNANRWLQDEYDSGRIPEAVRLMPHSSESGGSGTPVYQGFRARVENLTVEDCERLEKELKPVVARAAKAAVPKTADERLPW